MGMTPEQQQICKRMTTLTLWRGMLIGSALTLVGLDLFNGWLIWAGTPQVAPLANLLLPLSLPLMGILLGVMFLVSAQGQVLSRRLPGFWWYPGAATASSLGITVSFVLGWFFLGYSTWWLVAFLLNLTGTLLFVFFAGLLCCTAAIWYWQHRGTRRAAQS